MRFFYANDDSLFGRLMKVIDVSEEHKEEYFYCLEEWSDDPKEAGPRKALWYERMKDKGLGVKLALDDSGVVGGMIQYVPIEHSFAEGKDMYFVHCIWVHGHKQGRGNFQGRGMGKALLKAAEDDAKGRGAKGMVAWGLSMPFWMKASWFKKQGYSVADKYGMQVLLWKRFTEGVAPPKWIRPKKTPSAEKGRVTVTAFTNGWCVAGNMVFQRARRAAAEFGDKVAFQAIDTLDEGVYEQWGIPEGLYIDGKAVRTGPPPSYEKIRGLIAKKVRKLR